MTLSALIHWAGAQIFRAFDKNKVVLGFLVIQLVWYILKQLFTLVSVKVMDIHWPCRFVVR